MSAVEILSDVKLDFGGQSYYEFATKKHFWIDYRFRVMVDMLKRNAISLTDKQRGFEIGCGNGVVRSQIEDAYACTVDGSDLDIQGLELNPDCRGKAYLYDILERRAEFKQLYDFAVLFDVIEHIDDVPAFMDAVNFHTKPQSLVLINVPAMPSLYSAYDKGQGHCRRYTPSVLREHIEASGLDVVDMQYWGLSMVPVVALRKMVSVLKKPSADVHAQGFAPPSPLVHKILYGLMKTERCLFSRPCLGTSLSAIARKR